MSGTDYRGYVIDQRPDKQGDGLSLWWEVKLDGKVVNVQVSQEDAQGWVDAAKHLQEGDGPHGTDRYRPGDTLSGF